MNALQEQAVQQERRGSPAGKRPAALFEEDNQAVLKNGKKRCSLRDGQVGMLTSCSGIS